MSRSVRARPVAGHEWCGEKAREAGRRSGFASHRRALLVLPVLLTLNVCSAAAQERKMTRIEQDDPSIAYSGNWYSNDGAVNSGGTAALTNTRGARATIGFTGTGISWVGVMDGWAGIATVHLDGAMTVVDTYRDPGAYQQAIHAVTGLPAGPHSLSIEVTHERGPGTDGSWVWIDAFDIENGSALPGGIAAPAGRVEENHPALLFEGRWYQNENPGHSEGHAVLAMDAGSRATIRFNGTGVRWIAYRDEWSGIARVYVDGVLKTTIDSYRYPSQTQEQTYTMENLPFGTHTLTIEATGTRNASSGGSWIWLDAFDVAR